MGQIISLFHKRPASEIIEELDNNIRNTERSLRYKESFYTKISVYTTLILFVLYILFAYYVISSLKHWQYDITIIIKYVFFLLFLPFLMYIIVKWFTPRCYSWILNRDRQQLAKLRTKKRDILEEVKVTATYTVAKKILDKYEEKHDIELSRPDKSFTSRIASLLGFQYHEYSRIHDEPV